MERKIEENFLEDLRSCAWFWSWFYSGTFA